MRYLCQLYVEEKRMAALSKIELDALLRASAEYNHLLQRSGYLALALALEPVRTATTIRVQSGRTRAMDGPFAETREQLAGIILIDATDLDAALRVAAKIPMAELGSIEIRPVSRS
ncbi:YciI family protein [Dongia soli]|uniref:YciI family protein n=1 Tax=Dongia soli TaxID=600628 RepID=A0ABU5EEI5_9PROT|nr:YciI family protein [Dongia soli]MDY0884785.1 YciI family protein [Dongia soli]